MMEKLPEDVIPAYDLEQQLVQADTEAMLAEVEKRYRTREASSRSSPGSRTG